MQKILIIQLRQLGDILLTTPCLREIRRECPKAHISFLCHRMGKLVLDGNPYIDEIIYCDDSQSLWKQLQLSRQLYKSKFDLVIDFMNNPRSAILTRLSNGTQRVSYTSSRSLAYTELTHKNSCDNYIVREKFRLLTIAGFSPKNERLILPWSEVDLGPLVQLVDREAEFEEPRVRVVLSPTHRRQHRKWDPEKYARLADYLTESWGALVVWVWGPGEEKEIDKIQEMTLHPTFKAPRTSFRELAALIGNMDFFIGNSNGPSHVAVAEDIFSFQLHGHTDMRSWSPLNNRHRALQAPEYQQVNPASSCVSLKSISTSMVIEKLESLKSSVEQHARERHAFGVRREWRDVIC